MKLFFIKASKTNTNIASVSLVMGKSKSGFDLNRDWIGDVIWLHEDLIWKAMI